MHSSNVKLGFLALIAISLNSCSPPHQEEMNAAAPGAPWQILDGNHFQNWTGIDVSSDAGAAALKGSQEAVFRYPDGPQGLVKHGFRSSNDGTADWHDCQGIKLSIFLPNDGPVELKAYIGTPRETTTSEMVPATVSLASSGWHTVSIPWSAFAFDQANTSFLHNVKELILQVQPGAGAAAGPILFKDVRVMEGDPLALDCPIHGKSVAAGQSANYEITVKNCTGVAQAVVLSFVKHGWEAMTASVDPATFNLESGESETCQVHVLVPEGVAAGGHETQMLQAMANGDGDEAASVAFVTARTLPHPNILHTAAAWREVRDKVKKYPWAAAAQNEYVAQADKWQVPAIAQPPHNDPGDTMGPYLFDTSNEGGLMACGIAWQLTGKKLYAEKAAELLRRWSDPQNGYPKTFRSCNQGFVQEGHFTQHLAMAYDMILDSGVLSPAEIEQINASLRLDMQTIDLGNQSGAINNWNLSEMTGAFYCALALQDLSAADHFFAGPTGISNQLAKGVMDDGWWYECSVSYNTWCASEFSQAALAYEPWGVNFQDMKVPASYYRDASLSSASGRTPVHGGGADLNEQNRPFGMSKEIWGPNTHPDRQIRDMWNSLPPFLDYRGVMFGINDTTEKRPADQDQSYEIAYSLYHDPTYAGVVKKERKRSLLYGVPDLPAVTPDLSGLSAYADNAGVVMLRSQTPGRPQSEQIQAVLHYGTHGWAHGHFDRTDLLSLMRYGRSFYNPEMIWYAYEGFMYKFFVQTSVNHNMVVVDQKMQEAANSKRLLFYSGKTFQATAVETMTRWSNPPYGGMVYDYVPVKTFAEKCWREGRSVPIPSPLPAYGSLTDFTEPILQRRLLVVTDDYVIVSDYLKAKKKHTFDNLLQVTGFQGLDAPGKKLVRHDAQWNPDPVGSAQFVTDCDWYTAQAPARARFSMYWKADRDPKKDIAPTLCSEDGTLNLDVLPLWPQALEMMVGQSPQSEANEKKLWYTVSGDGKTLDQGKFGSWILGQANIDVPVQGLKNLRLETRVEGSHKNTLFWGNARLVTSTGEEIPLAKLPVSYENVVSPPPPGRDYYGGPLKIVGTSYSQAIPGEPVNDKTSAIVSIDLGGRAAVRFKATLGGAYPLGDAGQLRKTVSVRSEGTDARFLTLIEPYEKKSMVKSARALSADQIEVELVDGRTQELTIHNLEGAGGDISVAVKDKEEGKGAVTEETTSVQP